MDVALSHVTKRYAHKTVLNDFSVSFSGGKIHALLGENGAGKSTTAAILCGALPFDAGTVLVDGKTASFSSPRDAAAAGIYCVQQRPLLAESISVRENILLGTEYSTYAQQASRAQIEKRAVQLKRLWAPQLDMNALVLHIGGDERFYTSLISALLCMPSVLILDEPSALLDWEQRRALYSNIRHLAQDGMNIIVITHIMQEAELYTDTVTILKKNAPPVTYPESAALAGHIHDADGAQAHQKKDATTVHSGCRSSASCGLCKDRCELSFSGINVRPGKRPALYDAGFKAFCGAITLIKGMQESGLGTLEDVITGMEKTRTEGTFSLLRNERTISVRLKSGRFSPGFLRRLPGAACGIISSDRTFRASDPGLTVQQLLSAMYNGPDSKTYARKLIQAAGISVSPEEKVSALSGGMLQRLILARELSGMPDIIIACEPLQGLDPDASVRTTGLLEECARKGSIVIVLSSSSFPENLCHSIYRLEAGTIREVAV